MSVCRHLNSKINQACARPKSKAFLWIYSCFANSKIWFRFVEMMHVSRFVSGIKVTYAVRTHNLAFGIDFLLLFLLAHFQNWSIRYWRQVTPKNRKWISSRLSTHKKKKSADAQKVYDLRRIVFCLHRNRMKALAAKQEKQNKRKTKNFSIQLKKHLKSAFQTQISSLLLGKTRGASSTHQPKKKK